jgi:hypothetical protein
MGHLPDCVEMTFLLASTPAKLFVELLQTDYHAAPRANVNEITLDGNNRPEVVPATSCGAAPPRAKGGVSARAAGAIRD